MPRPDQRETPNSLLLGSGAAPAAPDRSSRIEKVERFIHLDLKVQQFKPVSDEYEKLKEEVKSWADGLSANDTAMFLGRTGAVLVTQRDNKTRIKDMAQVFRAFGRDQFLLICSVALERLKELPAKKQALIELLTDRTGPRRVKVVAMPSPDPSPGPGAIAA